MDDSISRQAAIDALGVEPLAYTDYEEGLHTKWADAKEALEKLPSAQPEIIRCKDCKHRPIKTADYDDDAWDCGFNIEFPDYRCPCRCDDGYYNRFPDDDWFCGNAERREDE